MTGSQVRFAAFSAKTPIREMGLEAGGGTGAIRRRGLMNVPCIRPARIQSIAGIAWIAAALLMQAADLPAAERSIPDPARPQPRAAIRRLSRREHEHTLRDLLGLPGLDVREMLPEDGRAHGFDKSADALELSAVHIAGCRAAAETAIAMATASSATPPAAESLRLLPGGQEFFKLALVEGDAVFLRNGSYDTQALPIIREALPHKLSYYEQAGLFPYRHSVGVFRRQAVDDHFALQFSEFKTAQPGRYRLRLSIWSFLWDKGRVLPQDKPEVATLHAGDRLIATCDAPSLTPTTHEIDAWLNLGDQLLFTAASIPPARVYQRPGRAAEYTGPGVALDHLEIEGPLQDRWPPAGHVLIHGGAAAPRTADVKQALTAFLARAFRRPATAAEVARLTALVSRRQKQGDPLPKAMRLAAQAALSSPEFLFIGGPPGPLDEWNLASRLSYFLWDSMPDDPLLAIAARGRLRDPEVLHSQVDRMLDDPRSQRFIDHFLDEWLDLREIDLTTPDSTLYPEYSPYLRDSMLAETRAFFGELIAEDLPVTTLVDADFAMLNQRLAEHYGLTGGRGLATADGKPVVGSAIRRVPLLAGSHRGGLLAQGSVLKVTSNGTVTSPVKRGAWLLREILDSPPEPPPPNIPAVDADVRGRITIREQLAAHSADAACAACHDAIDPPGFALECFDVIGGWRDHYRVLAPDRIEGAGAGEGPAVDTFARLEDGTECADSEGLRRWLAADPHRLARSLARQLIVYATGADIAAADRGELDRIVDRSADSNYGVRTLIHEVVSSRLVLQQ
jgi:hypothetical protein